MGRWVGPATVSRRTLAVLTQTALHSSSYRYLLLRLAFQVWGISLANNSSKNALEKAQLSARQAREKAAWLAASSPVCGSTMLESRSKSPSVASVHPFPSSRLDARSTALEDELRQQLGLSKHRESERQREVAALRTEVQRLHEALEAERAAAARMVSRHDFEAAGWREKTKHAIQETAEVGKRIAEQKAAAPRALLPLSKPSRT